MEDTTRHGDLAGCTACACFNVRRAGRQLTQQYDEALRPVGLRGTQFSLLAVLEARGGLSIGSLAQAMGMDRTTLTRNLRLLERDGLVASVAGNDRRYREIHLTGPGREKVAAALPLWHSAQERAVERLGPERFAALLAELEILAG